MFDVNPQGFMRLTQNDTANLAVVLDNVPSGGTFSPTSTLTIRKDFGQPALLTCNGVWTASTNTMNYKFVGDLDVGLYRYTIKLTNASDVYTLLQDEIEITKDLNEVV